MRFLGNQESLSRNLMSFRKITSGNDDVLLINTPGYTQGPQEATENLPLYAITHYQAQEKYVAIAADDKMYLRLQEIGDTPTLFAILGYVQFIRIDI